MSITYFQSSKSEAVNKGWLSQDQREMLSKEFYSTKALKKVSCEDRAKLFSDLYNKKGKNLNGGTYGQGNCEMTMRRSQQTF